jgi:acetyl-CoA carboxylase carboxyltransferase component
MSEKLMEIVPESPRQPYDMYDVIREIVDDGDWFDLKPKFAKNVITCFARFGGQPAGIVANQPKHLAGVLDNDSADKAARFINLCDAFNIPLVFLQDVPGFMVGSKVEHAGIIRHGAKMLYAVSRATVPKVTVVVAWPGAEISVMGAEGAVEIIGRSAIEASEDPEATREAMLNAVRQQIDPYIAAGNAVIDDIIDPRETRQTIAEALKMARNKHVEKPKKRHGVMPV